MRRVLLGFLCAAAIVIADCSRADTVKRFKDTAAQKPQTPVEQSSEVPPVPSGSMTEAQVDGKAENHSPHNPVPGRVSLIEPLSDRGLASGPQAFRRKRSVWRNGEVMINGNWEAFYVWTSGVDDQCAVGTATLADHSWYREYPCPKPVGQLFITGIDQSGMIISFASVSRIEGTFHLGTHEWTFTP